ncbi:SDR family NAD(P)-dependent oxidoreductase [bacterium]|nr:SDR family NAD(P)-dependent oxidoreductase [bacterium]
MIAEIAFDSKMDIVNQHRVDQGLILAGAIQLNAVLEISGFRPTAGKVVRFQDILFQRPIRIAQETQISLQLTRTETNEYQFSITNCESDSIYTDGRISLKEPEIILSEAAHSNLISIPTDQFETAIRSAGLDHGPLYQVVSEIQYADTLAKSILKIPPMWQTLETQPLAISLVLDGAFQTAAALIDPAHGLFIPHRIRSMEIFHTGAFSAYSCEANLVERSDTITFDISVKSDSGQTVALLKGFSLAPVAKGPSDTVTVQVLEPAWHPFEKSGNPTQANRIWIIGSSSSNFEITSRPDGTAAIIHAIYPSSISSLIDSIDAAPFTPQIILLDSKWIGPSADSALQVLFELGQRLFKIQPAHPINIFWLQENGGFADSILSMVIGFARTLYRENPFIRLHGVTIASDTRPDIRELFFLDHEIPTRIRINEQTIETEKLQLSAVQKPQQSPPLHGTDYNILVTGGLGGIGTHLIRELTHHWQVNVIAIGRRPASPETERRCKQLAGPGTRVLYFSADVSQVDELEQALIQAAVPIHGVFHLAGRIEDRRFQDKAWTEFQSVIAPKIDGVLHLDALTRTQPLAFFTIFGSVTGILGNVGQADYSAANGFLNGFAEYRRFLSASGIRNGVTTCIGWPLWEEGGMAPDIKWLELMESNLKTRVRMPNREAWNLLPGLICGASAAPVVIAGKIDQLKQKDSIIQGLTTSPQSPSSELRPGGVLPKSRDELLVEVQTMFNVFFQLPTHAVGFESDIEEFGLDSIAVMDFVDSFYKKTGIELNPSLFFSFRTIGELIDHILTTHVEQNQDASVAPVR